jgi:biofilm PGA synthesis N-glycosyltransferase PgaC
MAGLLQIFGISFIFWLFIGCLRFIFETLQLETLLRSRDKTRNAASQKSHIEPSDVAVLIAAHNEELTIESTIESVKHITSTEHIYVVSDGSSDRTVEAVKNLGCTVEDLQPNRGKANALVHMLGAHDLYNRYKAVMIMDADLTISPNYFDVMLKEFDDPKVAAAVSRAVPHWPNHRVPRWNMLVTAYRVQVWRLLQFCIRYGQTWKYMNVTPIIPGGSSIYRTSVLRQIEINTPNLIIEDFNMTFEVHHKKLGRISYCWNATIIDQEPYSIRDFTKQIFRWYLGFWQTVRLHGPWFSFFWSTMALFAVELGISSIIFMLLPLFLVFTIINFLAPASPIAALSVMETTFYSIFLALFAIEYIVTIFIAFLERRPLMLVYGLLFFPLRYIESAVFLYTLPRAFFGSSSGTWKSPKRISYGDHIDSSSGKVAIAGPTQSDP